MISERAAVEPIALSDVVRLFQMHGPSFKQPNKKDLTAFCAVLNMLAGAEQEAEQEMLAVEAERQAAKPASGDEKPPAEPLHPFVRLCRARMMATVLENSLAQVREAAAYLARELPRMNEVSRKAIMGARVHGAQPSISKEQLDKLEGLRTAAAASRPAFDAAVFQVIGKAASQPDWYAAARIIAFIAREAWTNAGNTNVSIGKAATTPVARLTHAALAELGIGKSLSAVVYALSKWELTGNQGS